MKRWEYRFDQYAEPDFLTITTQEEADQVIVKRTAHFNALGVLGWELVRYDYLANHAVTLWKREIPEHEWADPKSNKAFADWADGK